MRLPAPIFPSCPKYRLNAMPAEAEALIALVSKPGISSADGTAYDTVCEVSSVKDRLEIWRLNREEDEAVPLPNAPSSEPTYMPPKDQRERLVASGGRSLLCAIMSSR
jgi:hypothetical protein